MNSFGSLLIRLGARPTATTGGGEARAATEVYFRMATALVEVVVGRIADL